MKEGMEALLMESFFFCFYRLIPVVLTITSITGILIFCYMRVDVDQEKITGSYLVNMGGRTLAFIFREGLYYSILLISVAFILYSTIFAWSIKARIKLPSEREYLESLHNRDIQVVDPISSKTNLIGATHDEVDTIFGKADRNAGICEQYKGVTDWGKEYRIKVVFFPVINRVAWYESELFVG